MFPYIALPIALAIFVALNYYIGLRGRQWLQSLLPGARLKWAYWAPYWLLALSFLFVRMASGWLPSALNVVLTYVSSYWMAAYVYVLPMLIVVDLLRLLGRMVPARMRPDVNLVKPTGALVAGVFLLLLLYGTWNARTPVVVDYAVTIPKAAGSLDRLNVVLVSDTHLGAINGNGFIRRLVDDVNRLQPDLVLLAGDIIDDDFRPFVEQDMAAELSQMQARFGVFSVLGNHDAGSENLPVFRAHMERAGIHLLVDEWVKVADSFFVVGRNDSSQRRHSGEKALAKTLAGVDRSLPVLLMDHQPNRLDEAVAAGVDLQVSGHTHRGQMWPGSLITSRIFEVDWGYLKKASTQFVVSLGYGTWGPPIRVGNRPEVVRLQVTFGK